MERRSFIHNLLFLSGGFLVGCGKRMYSGTETKNAFRGRVLAAGKGVADVVISDGYSVVKTAADGSYQLPVNSLSQHVFVSVPSGYGFPHDKHLARHYKTVSGTDHNEMNFELERLPVNDDNHQFIIWADPQVKNEKDVAKMMNQSVPDVQKYLATLQSDTLIHGICVGDIVWDNHDLFGSYNKAVELCGVPFFQAIGNHDMDYRMGGDETSDATFKQHYGPTYYSFNRGKVHYVVLDDVWYLGKDREYKGYIAPHQLEWLKKDLSFVPTESLVVLCAHIPVHSVENKQALYDILAPYKVHIMTGHTHHNNNYINGNVYEHVHGTVCGAWWMGPVCEDGTPPGYAIYEVKGTELSWFYKSTGQEKDFQVTTQIFSDENGNQKVQANVWNWDHQWKVEWWADDTYQGQLKNVKDFDPLAVALYKGDQLPKGGRTFIEPIKTEHVFPVTNLPSGAKQIKIVATDAFGNKYQSLATV